jgi:cyclohexadieny/prephenate dehydrogenase
MASPVLFDRLALIGVGLIGGSIARAARALGIVREIVATSRSEPTRQRIRELGLADAVMDTSAAAVAGADLVIVCVPIGACGAVAKDIGPHLKPGATVSDVGSVTSSPAIRSPAPKIPGPTRASPSYSSTAGASSRRRRTPRRPPSSGWCNSGRRSAPASRSCRRSITIWCSRSRATSRT